MCGPYSFAAIGSPRQMVSGYMQFPFLLFAGEAVLRFMLFQNTLRASPSLACRLEVLAALHCVAFAMRSFQEPRNTRGTGTSGETEWRSAGLRHGGIVQRRRAEGGRSGGRCTRKTNVNGLFTNPPQSLLVRAFANAPCREAGAPVAQVGRAQV